VFGCAANIFALSLLLVLMYHRGLE